MTGAFKLLAAGSMSLDGPIHEGRYQIPAARGRLAGRVEAWDDQLRRR